MKLPTFLTVLITTALPVLLRAAPAPSTQPPAKPASKNETLPNDLAELFARVVKYDHATVASMAAQYKAALSADTPILLSSDDITRAAEASSDILPFCIGIAANPTRTRIFKRAMTCDMDGFSTLYTFTAYTKQDNYLAPKPMCSGLGSNPTRSMIFSNKTSCTDVTWKSDFTFYESAKRFQQVAMWQSSNPHRMVIYPMYKGDARAWRWAYYLQYRTHFRPASDAEMATLKSDFTGHLEVHKKLRIDTPENVATKRCATLLIDSVVYPSIPTDHRFSYAGADIGYYVKAASEAQCSKLVKSSQVYSKRFSVGDFGSYEVMIDNKVYAAASMKVGSETRAESLRVALQESMRAGQPVMVSTNPSNSKDNIVVFVQGSAIVIGEDEKVFGTPPRTT
ncbi:hypothetical protein BGZ96_008753 [Linnemannia gamsii]|uniref:Uncharacterized protein n=1 Tax=Linnemannia gamsii TaxID=64522 RepID=A0ABQ7KFF6_9FUNG|nr:hypothetical protein BGZ96_008753 [Linnemannia gamsii]